MREYANNHTRWKNENSIKNEQLEKNRYLCLIVFILTTRLQGAAREAQEVLGEEQVLVGAQVARLPRSLLAKQVAEISVRPDYLRDSESER